MAIGTCDNCDRRGVPVRCIDDVTTQCFLCTGDTDPDPYGEMEDEPAPHPPFPGFAWHGG
jgi:hypothetical protein